jgi:hypothetical protein
MTFLSLSNDFTRSMSKRPHTIARILKRNVFGFLERKIEKLNKHISKFK